MAKFMANGYWARHVRRMRIIYKKKHDILLGAIAHYFGVKATVLGQGAGLHVVLRLHEGNAGDPSAPSGAKRVWSLPSRLRSVRTSGSAEG